MRPSDEDRQRSPFRSCRAERQLGWWDEFIIGKPRGITIYRGFLKWDIPPNSWVSIVKLWMNVDDLFGGTDTIFGQLHIKKSMGFTPGDDPFVGLERFDPVIRNAWQKHVRSADQLPQENLCSPGVWRSVKTCVFWCCFSIISRGLRASSRRLCRKLSSPHNLVPGPPSARPKSFRSDVTAVCNYI